MFQTFISDWAYPNLFYTNWPIPKLFTWHPVCCFFSAQQKPRDTPASSGSHVHSWPGVKSMFKVICLLLYTGLCPYLSTLTGSWLQVKTTTSKRQMALAGICCSFITICTPSTQRTKNFWSSSIHRWNFLYIAETFFTYIRNFTKTSSK